ncbi:MAG: hypothetical protein ABI761_00845 [Saprospiraceae bacterium]
MTEKGNKRYATGVRMDTIALLISIVLMMANKFITIEKVPAKVKVGMLSKINTSGSNF